MTWAFHPQFNRAVPHPPVSSAVGLRQLVAAQNMVDLISLAEGLQALSLPLQLAVGSLWLLLTLLAGRVLSNALPSKAPPVDEGIPFVGGLIKFSKVGRVVWSGVVALTPCTHAAAAQAAVAAAACRQCCRRRRQCLPPVMQPSRLQPHSWQHTPAQGSTRNSPPVFLCRAPCL